eukprot:Awhi_evm1s3440
MSHSKLKWHIRCSTLSESRLVKQVQVLKSSFRGPRRSSYKVIESLIAEISLEESFDDFARKEIILTELKCLVKTRLCFKLVSGTHGLRSELSRRDIVSNLCMCCDLDREESVEHLLLECP